MEKENLDDLMRQKFDTDDPGARFEFQEEYWEQAQAMLEADERKRKRRFLWWWWLGAGCLLLGVGLWFWSSGNAHQGKTHSEQAIQKPNQEIRSKAQYDKDLLKNSASGTSSDAAANPTDNPSETISAHTNKPATHTTASQIASPAEKHAKGQRNTEGKHSLAATWPVHSSASGEEKQDRSTQPPTDPLPKSSQLVGKLDDEKMGREQMPQSVSESKTAHHEVPATQILDNAPSPSRTSEIEAGEPLYAEISNSEHREHQDIEQIQPVDYQWPLLLPEVPFLPKADPSECPVFTNRYREPLLSVGLGASALAFFPSNKGTQWGGAAGIFADYRLSRSWSISSGVAWRYLPLSTLVADSIYEPLIAEQLRYSFGFEQVRTSIRPLGLHTIEIPIALRWHSGHWYLEGGASVSQLIGVRADWVEQRSASLQFEPRVRETTRKVWSDLQLYRNTWISPMLGSGWQRGKCSVVLRSALMPANIAPPSVSEEPRPSGWRFGAELGLRWRIF